MTKNFRISDAVAIQVGEFYADLHNDFNLQFLEVDLSEKVVIFSFVRTADARGLISPYRLTLTFVGIDYLRVSPGALAIVGGEVMEIGYKGPLDFDLDWLMNENQANPADHFFLRLSGDEFIRLHGASATARISPSL